MDEWSRRVKQLKRSFAARRERGAKALRDWFALLRASRELSSEEIAARIQIRVEDLARYDAGAGWINDELRDRIVSEFSLSAEEEAAFRAALEDLNA